jgi:hypothetical protein
MPPLDIAGFVAPEQKFEGLYKIGEAAKEQKTKAQEAANANKKNLKDSLKYMMDPKDFYSGTVYDPVINQKYMDTYDKALEFISTNPNATDVQLNTYMSPYLRDLSDYSIKAKTSKEVINKGLESVSGMKGIDKNALYKASTDFVHKDEAGNLQSPNLTTDPVAWAMENKPEEVFTNETFDDWFKNQEKKDSEISKEFGSYPGTVSQYKLKIQAPSWAVPELDKDGKPIVDKKTGMGKMIPRYDVAMDGENAITHEGEEVRLATEEDFRNIVSDPARAGWVKGQVKLRLKEYKGKDEAEIDINSPQAGLVARNIVWEEMKRRNPGSFTSEESRVTKTREPREGSGGDGAGGAYRNYFDEISRVFKVGEYGFGSMEDNEGRLFHYSVNNLEPDTGAHIVELINKRFPDTKYNADQVYIVRNNAGNLEARASRDNKLLMPISTALNIGGEQPGKFGKEKAVIETEKEKFQNVRQGKIIKAVNVVKNGVKAAVKKVTGTTNKVKGSTKVLGED